MVGSMILTIAGGIILAYLAMGLITGIAEEGGCGAVLWVVIGIPALVLVLLAI